MNVYSVLSAGRSVATIITAIWVGVATAQPSGSSRNHPLRRHVLIVVGIAGDEEHQIRFRQTVDVWRQWLTECAGVKHEDILLLVGKEPTENTQPATAENLREAADRLIDQLESDEALWVFLLGHGSEDRRHGWFHLPGPDLNAAQWAGLFARVKAKEQVFWLTHSASGRILKAMSFPGRIVITATDDGEVNETRFPRALAEIMKQQLARSDSDETVKHTAVSVLDLFRATTARVEQSFQDEQLLATEHAQLDDNGDGVGTESQELAASETETGQVAPSSAAADGLLADRVSCQQAASPSQARTDPSSDHQTNSPPVQDP